ncbi:MAG TPA: alkaline phosphatase family protein [Candidatus Cybelea sp.]
MSARSFTYVLILVASIAAAGCGGNGVPSIAGNAATRQLQPNYVSSPSPIQHVVIMVQENRTFNDFFATFPGGDGTVYGNIAADPKCSPPILKGTIPLTEANLVLTKDLDHKFGGYRAARDKGNMDGFDKVKFGNDLPECTYPYMYTDPSQIQPYWAMAEQYTLAEHMFTTQGSGSFTAHQDLIAGTTVVEPHRAMVDLPTCSGTTCVWGCDAPPRTHVHLITSQNKELNIHRFPGPFPCSNQYAVSFPTLRDLLDAANVSWKYYVPPATVTAGRLFSAFDAIAPVRYGPEWGTNIISPETQIYNDVQNGQLAHVSWVMPDMKNSDHPGQTVDNGPEWVASVVNAIGESPYWGSTAIVIVWDDWGGLYDNAPPPQMGYGGLGFRVPAIVVSPYARAGYISPTSYEFGSILKYIENNWNLGTLGTTDQRANSLIDCFNYVQAPIPFQPIASSKDKSYFIRQKPSYKPLDDD